MFCFTLLVLPPNIHTAPILLHQEHAHAIFLSFGMVLCPPIGIINQNNFRSLLLMVFLMKPEFDWLMLSLPLFLFLLEPAGLMVSAMLWLVFVPQNILLLHPEYTCFQLTYCITNKLLGSHFSEIKHYHPLTTSYVLDIWIRLFSRERPLSVSNYLTCTYNEDVWIV